jgi:PAP2 superfamily
MKKSGMKLLMSQFRQSGGIPLLATVAFLSIITRLYAGDLCCNNNQRFWGRMGLLLLFVLISFFLDLIHSIFEVKRFVNPQTGQVNVVELWREVYTNPLPGMTVAFIMFIGVTNAQDLSEVYRISTRYWHDAELWQLELACFTWLKGSFIDYPAFWDYIYFSLWTYLIVAFAIVYKAGKFHYVGILSISTVLSFFITRLVALQYATAGPVFYQPEFFNIAGTLSSEAQAMLRLYMQGKILQNGFIPGTMAMPSLHVGLTFIATWLLACNARWSLWLTVPLTGLVWLSTIMLGWHYIVDGLGGILVAAVSMAFAHVLLKVMPREGTLPSKLGV